MAGNLGFLDLLSISAFIVSVAVFVSSIAFS
ncbi:hypothetical protein BAC1_01621 [uncultured bacterium]|nr:hypothetical protein BAC1_01621 [uncultured bacterium]